MENKEESVGIIKMVRPTEGYGFLDIIGGDRGVFFHARSVLEIDIKDLRPGQKLKVKSVGYREKGLFATEVSLFN